MVKNIAIAICVCLAATIIAVATHLSSNKTQAASSVVWHSMYWNNTGFQGTPVVTRDQTSINFNTYGNVVRGVNNDYFTARFTTTNQFAVAGTYTFTATVDDGMRLYVDNQLVMDHWVYAAATTYTATYPLTVGTHTFRVDYLQGTWAKVLSFNWTAPSSGTTTTTVIPSTTTTTLAPTTTTVPGTTTTTTSPDSTTTTTVQPTTTTTVVPPPNTTGIFTRPFSADSLWYRPVSTAISAGAFYGTGNGSTNSPGIRVPSNGVTVDYEWIIQGSNSYPVKDLWTTHSWPAKNSGGTDTGKVVHIDPTLDIPFDSGMSTINAGGGYLTPDGSTWLEGNAIEIHPAGSTPYMGDVYPDESMSGRGTYGGHGASGLSTVGGILRPGELEGSGGIQHAIQFTAPMAFYGLRSTGVGGGAGFTTPSISADGGFNDSGSGNYYGGSAFWMGSLLAIRPQDQQAALNKMTTVQGRNIVNVLVNYGGYVTENSASPPGSGWEAWMYQMDHAAVASSGVASSGVKSDLANVLPFLYVVMNNKPAT